MPRKFLKRFMPDVHKLNQYGVLKPFGAVAHDTNLWHLNRKTAAGGFAIGIFFAFMPMPFQMIAAAAVAIFFRVNLPLSVAMVWISNPITMPAMLYGSYRVGSFLLRQPSEPFLFELSVAWFQASLSTIVPALVLGSVVVGGFFSGLAYLLVRKIWRQAVQNAWNERLRKRRERLRELKEEFQKRRTASFDERD
ncbi:DUF2062 domain-containing protein [Aliidiomarina haloalkalitolerans]|uniref:DUF2062 domain-containing protein n=1 Tax=Aliidiomarina haloalkalitolerans TaxID=859059 RepID=A0A432VXQ2_9GAMM|nr:DUF2062 domain-containing protein [Aliidiomarina haloalkalitolerans]RUO21480.1 DUF2062 domain-containing protein [Aliidiomarina haloalkalitolerans]